MTVLDNIKILEKYIESGGFDTFTEQAVKKLISRSLQKEKHDLGEILNKLDQFERKYEMVSERFH